uniref:Hypothetical secreted peptide n=1 Tax=Glossina morsitans morsitans TaxID=37546 RepID=D3TSJ1_GLOMM
MQCWAALRCAKVQCLLVEISCAHSLLGPSTPQYQSSCLCDASRVCLFVQSVAIHRARLALRSRCSSLNVYHYASFQRQ